MRARPLALTLLAVAALLAAAYGVVEWLDSAATEANPSPPPQNEPASSPVAQGPDLFTEPPAASTLPPTPERAESPAPLLDPTPATVHLRGTVTLFEHLDVDKPLLPPDGTFDLAVLTAPAALHEKVAVKGGNFEVDVPPSSELEIRTFQFGERVAWIRGESRRAIPEDAHLELVATCLASRLLDVVDAADGKRLEDVVVLVATNPDEHPGVPRANDLLIDRKPSPVELAPFFSRIASHDHVADHSPLWVGAKDHAFQRIELDFDRGSDSLRVALDRCGSLTVHLNGDANLTKCALWLRLTARRERAFYLATFASFAEPVRIDHVRPGDFGVEVVRGGRTSARSYGGAVAEIEAGRDTDVAIDVSPPPKVEAGELPITGTIEIPAAWGNFGEMYLHRIDKTVVDEIVLNLRQMQRERAHPRTLRFETTTRSPGLWNATIEADSDNQFGGPFFVGPEGATDLSFAIGEPADLTIEFKDASTGAHLERSPDQDFFHVRWDTTDATDPVWGHDDSTSGRLSVRVPIGPITLRSEYSGFAPVTECLHIQPGANKHVALLPLPVGVVAVLTVDGKPASLDVSRCPISLRWLEGSDAKLDEVERTDSWWEIYVDHSGLYELTVLPLEGFLPVKPIELNLQVGRLQRVDIPLMRRP